MCFSSLTKQRIVIILSQRLKHIHFGFYRRGVAFANSNHRVNSRFLAGRTTCRQKHAGSKTFGRLLLRVFFVLTEKLKGCGK